MGGLKQIILDWCGWVDACGFQHLSWAQATWLRWFWGILIVLSAGGSIYQVYTIVFNKYLLYNSQVQTSVCSFHP
jgi:hypothetical protein